MKAMLLGFIGGLILPLLFPLFPLQERNYRGLSLPLLGFLFPLLGFFILKDDPPSALPLIIFGILGLLDDIWGRKDVKGFKGHFSLLLRGQFSTGWVKALGGSIGGLFTASLFHHSFLSILLSAFIISASANFLNLLDLRPGRCLKAFLFLSFLAFLMKGHFYPFIFGFSLGFIFFDLREKAMLGDAGSNSLGALLGLSFSFAPLPLQLIYAFFLLVILVMGEFFSLSELIERIGILRFLDLLGRKPPL